MATQKLGSNNGCAQVEIRERCEKPISTIFFDLDNTLIPTRKGDAKACSKIADILHTEHNLPRERANEVGSTYLKAFRRCPDNSALPLVEWRTQLWEDTLPASHKYLAAKLYAQWVEYRMYYLAPSSEIIEMLQTLRHQYLLGIISNGPSAAQWEKIDRLGLSRFFDCILVSSDLPWAKPNRNIFGAACHYLGVQPDECAMVGDKLETDVQGGVESKMGATIWLPLPANLRLSYDKTLADLDEHIRPDFTLQDVLELPSILPLAKESTAVLKQHEQRPLEDRRSSESFVQKTTRNREASYNQFLTSVPDLFSSNSNSCDSNGSCLSG